MPDKKPPVIVYVYGYDLKVPDYATLLVLKSAFEKAGQDFLLIPEPNEKNEPSIPLNSKEYNAAYIKTQIEKHFCNSNDSSTQIGGNTNFAGREANFIVDTHGDLELSYQQYGHGNALNDTVTNSKDLYSAILSSRTCTGIFDGSCFSATGGIALNEAIRETGAKNLPEKIKFTSSASPFEASFQLDGLFLVYSMIEYLEKGKTIDIDVIREIYLRGLGRPVPITTKEFYPKNLEGVWSIEYNNTGNDLELFYNKKELPKYYDASYTEFFRSYNIDLSAYNIIEAALKNSKNFDEFTKTLNEQNLYGETLAWADILYNIPSCLDYDDFFKGAVSHYIEEKLYRDLFIKLEKIPEGERNALLEQFTKENYLNCLTSIGRWESFVSDNKFKEEIIKSAAMIAAAKDPRTCFTHLPIWKDFVPENERVEIIKIAAKQDPKICCENFSRWQGVVSENDRRDILKTMAEQNLKIYFSYCSIWKNSITDTENKEILENAVKTSKEPKILLENFSKWREVVSENDKKDILENLAEKDQKIFASYKSILKNTDAKIIREIEKKLNQRQKTDSKQGYLKEASQIGSGLCHTISSGDINNYVHTAKPVRNSTQSPPLLG